MGLIVATHRFSFLMTGHCLKIDPHTVQGLILGFLSATSSSCDSLLLPTDPQTHLPEFCTKCGNRHRAGSEGMKPMSLHAILCFCAGPGFVLLYADFTSARSRLCHMGFLCMTSEDTCLWELSNEGPTQALLPKQLLFPGDGSTQREFL
jgi:hypothetical protein